jgi:hypothetical protein
MEHLYHSATVRILHIFYTLSRQEHCRALIHFPIGNVGYPTRANQTKLHDGMRLKIDELGLLATNGNYVPPRYQEQSLVSGHPILIFENLTTTGYKRADTLLLVGGSISSTDPISTSVNEEDIDLFLDALNTAFGYLKQSKVVMTDVRLPNIFYRKVVESRRMELKFIDLDEAYLEGEPIPADLFHAMQQQTDYYPKGEQYRKAIHGYYDFFFNTIASQLRKTQIG